MTRGKFDGVLLVSDLDDTMLYTTGAVRYGGIMPEIPAYNVKRIRYFMDQGGHFAIVSGRVWARLRGFADVIPHNMPWSTGNGAAIVDPDTGEALFSCTLPDSVSRLMQELETQFPEISCELSRADNIVDILRPNARLKESISKSSWFREIKSSSESEPPFLKVLFLGNHDLLLDIRRFLLSRTQSAGYEIFFSSDTLLELVAQDANKGDAVKKLAELTNISLSHTYCIGDQENDLPMLALAKQAFAPANAVPALRQSGATMLCDCMEGAVGQAIDHLERIYG